MKVRVHVKNPKQTGEANPTLLGFVFRNGEELAELTRTIARPRRSETVPITEELLSKLRTASGVEAAAGRASVVFEVLENPEAEARAAAERRESEDRRLAEAEAAARRQEAKRIAEAEAAARVNDDDEPGDDDADETGEWSPFPDDPEPPEAE